MPLVTDAMEEWYQGAITPVIDWMKSIALIARSEYFTQHPDLLETYVSWPKVESELDSTLGYG